MLCHVNLVRVLCFIGHDSGGEVSESAPRHLSHRAQVQRGNDAYQE